jgi:uncharacterized protein (DUF58 family)
MNWSKYSVEDQKIPGISAFAIVLIIVSLYSQSKLVFFLASFFLIIVTVNQLYLKKAGNGLFFENIVERGHFFKDEKGKWTLTFRNVGYPILQGELRVSFDHYVSPLEDAIEPSLSMYEVSIPFSILSNQTKEIAIPYRAKMRGIARIRQLELHIPSLIGFGKSVLEYRSIIKTEAVVYPQPIPVKGLKEPLSSQQGVNVVPYSVYEDRLGPLGTRDYVPTDSFNRIHWKASARKQTLQTKVFERISEKSWNLSINVADGYALTGLIEQLISSVTEFAYYAVKWHIPYSLCINVCTAGSTPFYYIPKGEGKEHLQKVLETLASINYHNSIFPYDKMLSIYNRHLAPQPFFLHAGIRTSSTDVVLLYLASKGVSLVELKVEEDNGILTVLEAHQERRGLL